MSDTSEQLFLFSDPEPEPVPFDRKAFIESMRALAATPAHQRLVAAAYDREGARLGLLDSNPNDSTEPAVVDDPEFDADWQAEQAAKTRKWGSQVVETASLTSAQKNNNEREAIAEHRTRVVKQQLDR